MNHAQYAELKAYLKAIEEKVDRLLMDQGARAVAAFNVLPCGHCYCVRIAAGTCNPEGRKCCKCGDIRHMAQEA